ncbi:type IV pilus modification protein PilV [Steroidobacter flavus]|uniref:Type IV pilus modification protein PilV n=1 Tax=Steroidobacter flavus TaxID=1842136 RepID=A0ABV8SX25_9GAMM
MKTLRSSSRRAAGMTLVEVLVTLVIISVGLLGVAALQLTTVRNNYDSFVRTQAATLAGDMLDRMRANRSMVTQYEIDITNETVPNNAAGRDIRRWRDTLAGQLPRGIGGITYDDATRIVTIEIRWRERVDVGDDDGGVLAFKTASQI